MLENPISREPNQTDPLRVSAESFILNFIDGMKKEWLNEGLVDVGLSTTDLHAQLLRSNPQYAELTDATPEDGENPLILWVMEKLGTDEELINQTWKKLLADFPRVGEATKMPPHLMTERQITQLRDAILFPTENPTGLSVLQELINSYTEDARIAKAEFTQKVISEIVAERTRDFEDEDNRILVLQTPDLPIALGRSRLEDNGQLRWVFSLLAQVTEQEKFLLWNEEANNKLMARLLTSEQFRSLLKEFFVKRLIDAQIQRRNALLNEFHLVADTQHNEESYKILRLQEKLRLKFSEILMSILEKVEGKSALLHYMTVESSGDWEGRTLEIRNWTNKNGDTFIEMSLPISTEHYFSKKIPPSGKKSILFKVSKNALTIGKKIEESDGVRIEWLDLDKMNDSFDEQNVDFEEILDMLHSLSLQDLAITTKRHYLDFRLQKVDTLEDFQNLINVFKSDKRLFFDVTPGKIRFLRHIPRSRFSDGLN